MKENRKQALDYAFHDEGGYAERDTEGGGAVNMGITFNVFRAWRALKGQAVTWADLKAMSRDEAAEIYDAQYLEDIHFDELPAGIDYCLLDGAILGGVTGSIKLLQTALMLEPIDGHFGLRTRWASNHREINKLIADFCEARLNKYRRFKKTWNTIAVTKTGKTWGTIWSERISIVKDRALKMAAQ